MPKFSGSTDEKHVFTLPSEIERVRWLRQQAAPGGVAGLQIRTLFCAPGSQVEIRIEDAQGSVVQTLSGELPGPDVTVQIRVPEGATGGLLAKVQMPNHGLSAESEALQLTESVRLRSARWSTETVQRRDIVTLSAEARGAQDGRRAVVQIYERDPAQGAHDPVTQLRPRVESEAVTVKYRFQYPGDTAEITPEWEAPNGYRQPEFFYTVETLGVTADSKDAKSKGVMTFVDDLDLRLLDAGTQAPLTDQTAKLTLPDGSTQEETLNGEGRVQLQEVPPGPVHVQLPEYTLPTDADGGAGGVPDGATSFTMKNNESSVEVSTGGEEAVYVLPPRINVQLEHGLVGAPLDGTEYELKVMTEDGTTSTFEGTIGKEGHLRQALPLGAAAAALTLKTNGGDLTVPVDLSELADDTTAQGLQQRLSQIGTYDGLIDGNDGRVTKARIRAFQKALGQSPTGTIPEDKRPMLDGMRFRNA